MSFKVIFTPKQTNWQITAEEFVEALKKKWPDAEIKPTDGPHFCLDFAVIIGDLELLGSIYKVGNSLPVWCPFGPELAEFALWFRTLVPPQELLALMNDDYNYVIPLTPHTTVEDIVTMRTMLEPWGEGEEPPDEAFR